MRRAILSLIPLALLFVGASRASASGLDLRIGGFFPRGNDNLFADDCALYLINGCSAAAANGEQYFKGNAGAFKGVFGGAEYNAVIMPNLELGVHLDGFGRTVDSSYRNYTRPDGSEIRQKLKLSIIPLGATVRLIPTSKGARLAPYIGGGVDAVFYQYEEYGDFIDFGSASLDIVPDDFKDSGAAFGVHAVAGLRVYLNRDFAIVGEGRYMWAAKDMGKDFAPNEPGLVNRIDLSGASFVVGLHVRF